MPSFPIVESGYNPYRNNVQGKANEPICVAGLLDRARRVLGLDVRAELGEVYDRLNANAPRIAIIQSKQLNAVTTHGGGISACQSVVTEEGGWGWCARRDSNPQPTA